MKKFDSMPLTFYIILLIVAKTPRSIGDFFMITSLWILGDFKNVKKTKEI